MPPAPLPERVTLASGLETLDARIHAPGASPAGGIVVAHPHPAHGGHMDHPVVVLACERAAAAGLLALRFDFRGVRESSGSATDYLGHLDDWRRALEEVGRRAPAGPRLAAGFSYGARTLAALAQPARGLKVGGLLLLAPATRVPRTRRDFGNLLLGRPLQEASIDEEALHNLRHLAPPTEVLVGSGDVVAPADELRRHLKPEARLQVLDGLNHFFSTRQGAGPVAADVLGPAYDAALAALRSAADISPA